MKFDEFSNDSALILYDKAIELDNSYYLPHSNKASIYIVEKNYKKALIEMELCLLKKPDLAEAWFYTGMLYDKFKNSNKAKTYYSRSIELFNHRIKNDHYDDEFLKDADIINRAMSLKFIDDVNYMDGIYEILKKDNHSQNSILYEIEEKSKAELMKDMGL
jgi:tetratricopeptide (TPR) repeat protein